MRISNILAATLLATSFATAGFAAGGDSTEPPVKTETTKTCKNGKVWDETKARCVNPVQGSLTDDQIYTAAREMAYDGQYDNALKVLDLAANPNDPRILNYKGFANRKAGRVDVGMTYYQAALAVDPDYILARSYMGQAFVTQGNVDAARQQLAEIELRGGKDTWAYAALDQALRGKASDY